MTNFKLNDGNQIPAFGFGVFMVPNNGPCKETVLNALKVGYRMIDTAAAYLNEEDVGAAIKESGIPREEIYVISKLWMQDYSYDAAKIGIDNSLSKLQLDYVDLYLIHQPYGDVKGAWRALEEAKEAGKIRSIGISNHTEKFLKKLLPNMRILPAVNQMECNPLFQQKGLRKFLDQYGIRLQAWYPLGHGNRDLFNNQILQSIAQKYHKTVSQVILRWHLQEGIIAIPKAVNPEHIKENFDIFDFMLTDEDMANIKKLDTNKGTHDTEDMSNEERLKVYRVHD